MITKAKVSGFTDRQAIDYALRHLEGTAAEFFYSVLPLLNAKEAAEVLGDWAKFQDKFRKEFFREVSTADTAIDWNNL